MYRLPQKFQNFPTAEQTQEGCPPKTEKGRVYGLRQAAVLKWLTEDTHAHTRGGEEAQVLCLQEGVQALTSTEEAWATAHKIGAVCKTNR